MDSASGVAHGVDGAGRRVDVRVDDARFFDGDAIARPVTERLAATTALTRRLEIAALDGPRGERLAPQLTVREPLGIGAAIVTGAGALDAELIIHAVVSGVEERVSRDGVRRATLSALQRAADFQVRHLGMLPFGLGAGNLDPDGAAEAMLDAIERHVARAKYPARVTILAESESEAESFASRIARRPPVGGGGGGA